MSDMKSPPAYPRGVPYVEVIKSGRWTWMVNVYDLSLLAYPPGGWIVIGRRWARWKARRELARYVAPTRTKSFRLYADSRHEWFVGEDGGTK